MIMQGVPDCHRVALVGYEEILYFNTRSFGMRLMFIKHLNRKNRSFSSMVSINRIHVLGSSVSDSCRRKVADVTN